MVKLHSISWFSFVSVCDLTLFEFTVYLCLSSWLNCARFHGLSLIEFVLCVFEFMVNLCWRSWVGSVGVYGLAVFELDVYLCFS